MIYILVATLTSLVAALLILWAAPSLSRLARWKILLTAGVLFFGAALLHLWEPRAAWPILLAALSTLQTMLNTFVTVVVVFWYALVLLTASLIARGSEWRARKEQLKRLERIECGISELITEKRLAPQDAERLGFSRVPYTFLRST